MLSNFFSSLFCYRLWLTFLNIVLTLAIFLFLCFLHLPLLLNSDSLLNDEYAQTINIMLDMVQGGNVYFYHEGYNYQGILDGLIALPFFYFLGVNALALKLSAVMLCSLYFWSCFILVRFIKRELAWLVLVLIIFPPINMLISNYAYPTYWLVGLLGNLIFILFCRFKSLTSAGGVNYFFLFFFVGLSIYVYTYSILYIATIFISYILTSSWWGKIRSKILSSNLRNQVWSKQSTREKLILLFDVIILGFALGVLFSYIFGGFGIDVGGVSILQTNNLHKPLGQLGILVILRLLILGKNKSLILTSVRKMFSVLDAKTKHLFVLGICGFVVGISPRIVSVVTQEVKRGGQGFDVELSPLKILEHSWKLVFDSIPKTLGLFKPIDQMFSSLYSENIAMGFLVLMVILPLFVFSIWRFYSVNWESVKNVLILREIQFNPSILLIIFPLLICLSNIVTMQGPSDKYLFPLNFVFGILVALVLCRIKIKSYFLFIGVLLIWVGFYSLNIYRYYSEVKLLKQFDILVKREPMLEVIDFVKSKNIPVVYSNFLISGKIRFLGWNQLDFRSCVSKRNNSKAMSKQKKQCRWYVMGGNGSAVENPDRLMHNGDDFALVISNVKSDNALQKYMSFNKILFHRENIDGYVVFWNFLGNNEKINKIPTLTR